MRALPVHSSRRTIQLVAALLCVSLLAADPPKGTEKTTPDKGASGKSKGATNGSAAKKDADKSPLVEIPALPYLTLMLARDPSVHKELALDREQSAKVQEDIIAVDGPLWRLRDTPVDKSGEQIDALLKQLRDSLKRDLKKSQFERLDQIILQARGAKAIVSPEVAGKLKLTDDQTERLKKTLVELTSERKKLDQDPKASDEARKKLEKSEANLVTNILNAKQEKELTTLFGKQFDFSHVQQIGCIAPELVDVEAWINSQPLTLKELRGRVVVVHIYAFGCINCIRNLPHYQGWYDKFPPEDLTIIGIQTPETDSEKNLNLLRQNVKERGIEYPVAFDLRSENWKAWGNNMWPTVYLIDKQGQVRNWWRGELNWEGAKGEEFFRKRIAELIAE